MAAKLSKQESELVRAWLANEDGVGAKVAALPKDSKVRVLAALGYNTPSHLSMFGIM